MKPLRILIALVLLAGGVIAYFATRGKIDTKDADAKLKRIVEENVAPVKSVDCPAAKREKGTKFDCKVEFVAGKHAELGVEIIDDSGGFTLHWEKPIAGAEKLDAMITSGIKEQSGKAATVDCGKGIVEIPPD